MQPTNCPNCNQDFTNNFCSYCGQQQVHRLTMPHLWHDVIHTFTHADRGFVYLMGQLFKRPGIAAREYIVEGKRRRYFLPLQYLVLIGAVATIVVVNSHYIENSLKEMSGITGASKGSARQQAFMQNLALLQSKYYNFLLLLQLPFYAIAASIVYKRKKFNFAELLTLQTFVTAQTTIFSIILILLVSITKSPIGYINILMFLVAAIYHTWTYAQLFQERSFIGVLRAFGSHLLGVLFFILFAFIIGMCAAIILYS